jgi:hypothetical protein
MLINNIEIKTLYAKSDYNASRKLIVYRRISSRHFRNTRKWEVIEAFRREHEK